MIVLDTNILIAYLKGEKTVTDFIDLARLQEERFCVSAVSAVELLAFPKLPPSQGLLIRKWLQENMLIVDLNTSLALEAAEVCRAYRLKTADGIIAATALSLRASLMTRDKDFRRVKGLKIIQ